MDIATKLEYLKKHVDSIASHDDASEEEVRAALGEAKDHIDVSLAQAARRREDAAARREAQQGE